MTDPWNGITPPVTNSLISARRVDPSTRWDLFWGVDGARNPLLILQYGKGLLRTRRLPKLRGLRVETLPADRDTDERIFIRLTDREQRDIFLRFCRDIVDSTVLATYRGAGCGAVSRPDLAVAPASSGWTRRPFARP